MGRIGLVGIFSAALLLAFLPTIVAGAPVSTPPNELPSNVSSAPVTSPCTFSTFETDVLAGGTVVFGASCTLLFPSAITIPSSLSVTIGSGGFAVTLSGDGSTQLFIVNGGQLNITSITLYGGYASGTNAGTAGDGSNGANGATGASGPAGGVGSAGGAGTAGAAGGAGGAGPNALAGGTAEGGAILINSGSVNLTGDSITYSDAYGGSGGMGGAGGAGGNGATAEAEGPAAALPPPRAHRAEPAARGPWVLREAPAEPEGTAGPAELDWVAQYTTPEHSS